VRTRTQPSPPLAAQAIGGLAQNAWQRVLAAWWPVVLASLAAALSWWIAHDLLGHPQPFFAPIAAAISLSTSRIERSRRIAQMMIGVLLGIGVGEALAATYGPSTAAVGLIVLVTMTAALAAGFGFFNQGMMFANQAASSAILVVTLHRHGTGGERVLDAAVGGAVAFLLGVALFPAQPLRLLGDAELSVLRTLAVTLQRVAGRIATQAPADDASTLRTGSHIHRQLGALARTQATARASVRIAPRRWRLRGAVAAESSRTAHLELLSNAVLGMVRVAASWVYGGEPIAGEIQAQIASLADTLGRLASAPAPWPAELRADVRTLAEWTTTHYVGAPTDRDAIAGSILRAAADDLAKVIEAEHLQSTATVNGRRWHS